MRAILELALQAAISLVGFFAAGVAAAGMLPVHGPRTGLTLLASLAFAAAALLVWRRREDAAILTLAATAVAWLGGVGGYALPALTVVFALAAGTLAIPERRPPRPRATAAARPARLPGPAAARDANP